MRLESSVLNLETRILFADAIVYFQVVSYEREMPPYELLLKIFLCDSPWPNKLALQFRKYESK